MTESRRTSAGAHLWRRNGLIWLALLALLLTSFGSAYIPLGGWNTFIGIAIAFAKAALVALLFMELSRSRALIRLAGVAGLTFLFVLFGLTTTEVLMRLSGR
jgi:cytochrome c oxidase subunit IV